MRIDELTAEELLPLAVRLGNAERYAESRAVFQRLLDLVPDNGAALREAAQVNRREGRLQPAINLMRRALRGEPDNVEYWRDLDLMLREQGNIPWAVAALVVAVAIGRGKGQAGGVQRALREAAGLAEEGSDPDGQLALQVPAKVVAWIRHRGLSTELLGADELAVGPVRSVPDYCRERGLPYREVLPATESELTIPALKAEDSRQLSGTVRIPAAYVAEIPGAMMTDGRHLLLGEDGTLLTDRYAAPQWKGRWNDWVDPSFGRTLAVLSTAAGRAALWRVGSIEEAPVAECVSLVVPTDFIWTNWLVELLPRLLLLEELPEYDRLPLLVNANLPRQAREALALLDRRRRRVVAIDLHGRGRSGGAALPPTTYRFARLIQPSSMAGFGPKTGSGGSAWALDDHFANPAGISWLRREVLAKVGQGKRRRLYLSRAGQPRRRIVNEAELLAVLERRYGFAAVSPETLSFRAQAKLFAGAEAVVGPVGSAFINTLFCPPGAAMVSLLGDVANVNYALGVAMHRALEHDLRPLLCDADAAAAGENADFRVDVDQVVAALDAAGIGPRR